MQFGELEPNGVSFGVILAGKQLWQGFGEGRWNVEYFLVAEFHHEGVGSDLDSVVQGEGMRQSDGVSGFGSVEYEPAAAPVLVLDAAAPGTWRSYEQRRVVGTRLLPYGELSS